MGAGGADLAGGWGAGAKPRMRDFREFQYKIEKVPRSMKSMGPVASRRVYGFPYSIPKFLVCVKVYILVTTYFILKFIKSGGDPFWF